MIAIDPAKQSDKENYKLLTGSIVPRPIALVTTLSRDGVLNAAPYSYFSIIASQPPLISVSVQRKQGDMKDTARNAMEHNAFVVHIVDSTNVEAANQTAASLPSDQSEVTFAGLTPVESNVVPVPGIREAKIRMECELYRTVTLGDNDAAPACDLLIGRVVQFHIAHDIYESGYIRIDKLQPVSRMVGNDYVRLGETFALERPE